MWHTSYRYAAVALTMLVSLCLWCDFTWAIVTPYDRTPAAIVTQDFNRKGLIWDYEFANHFANNPSRKGFVVAVLDFCHSGGFVNELSALSNTYVAAACDWDEYSFGGFGQKFMNESKTKTLHQSFESAKDAVKKDQTPQEHAGAMGGLNLSYLTGDRAVLFSADEPGRDDFWQDITTARDALLGRPEGAWPGKSIGAYFGDGTKKFDDGTRVNSKATRNNLFGAIDRVYADPSFTGLSVLFMYLNDHGTSTDVLKSRHRGGRYEYEITTSLYRNAPDEKYGIWKVCHQVFDQDISHYTNIRRPKAGWDVSIVGGWMEWYSTNPGDPSTWLESGVDYAFGYDHPGTPRKVSWNDWATDDNKNPCDWGRPDGSAWGRGKIVYGANRVNAPDPAQWPGWDNGGDGWVLAPAWAIPEPATLLLFGYGLIAVIPMLRRKARK